MSKQCTLVIFSSLENLLNTKQMPWNVTDLVFKLCFHLAFFQLLTAKDYRKVIYVDNDNMQFGLPVSWLYVS